MAGKFFSKPDPDLQDRVPAGQHLASGFPVLTYGETPLVRREDWQLEIRGLATPQVLTWADLMAMPQSEFTADFHCVTRWSKLDVSWRGVKVTDLMARIELSAEATAVMQHCYGGYTTNLRLEDFIREDNFLAYEVLGEPLAADHGGPLRLVVPHLYAWKSGKWLNGLEFLAADEPGFWERNGYHMRGEPFAEERYSD